jgi:hypothetical protein
MSITSWLNGFLTYFGHEVRPALEGASWHLGPTQLLKFGLAMPAFADANRYWLTAHAKL